MSRVDELLEGYAREVVLLSNKEVGHWTGRKLAELEARIEELEQPVRERRERVKAAAPAAMKALKTQFDELKLAGLWVVLLRTGPVSGVLYMGDGDSTEWQPIPARVILSRDDVSGGVWVLSPGADGDCFAAQPLEGTPAEDDVVVELVGVLP